MLILLHGGHSYVTERMSCIFNAMIKTILFPSSIINKNVVDESLKSEYEAVIATDLFDVALFDNAEWFDNDKLVVKAKFDEMKKTVYRGFMMPDDKYNVFYDELKKYNIELINDYKEYRLMHIFPEAYEYIKDDTAKILTFPLHEKIDVNIIKKNFKKFMVKDFVKSVKGSDFPKYFDENISQDEFDKWMEKFYCYRGKLLTGGICIKEFLNLKYYGNRTNEFRIFYANNEVVSVSRNSGQADFSNVVPDTLVDKYRYLNSNYYTVDFAELIDGKFVIVEVGDGQVSGLSDNQNYINYFRALYYAFNK